MENQGKNKRKVEDHPNVKGRVLPHNLEAEQAVLGSVLLDENAPAGVLVDLAPGDFYSPTHKNIFEAMQSVNAKGKPVDIVTLIDELEALGQLDAAGGIGYLTSLSNVVPSAANVKHYAEIVQKNATLRKLIESAARISDLAFTGDADGTALRFAEAEIYSIAEKTDRSTLQPARIAIDGAIATMEFLHQNPGAGKGIPTGFKMLDNMLNGFQPSDLILIAARPSEGKTSLGMNFITHALFDGNRRTTAGKPDPYKCAVFNLEMSAEQLAKRLLCSVAEISMTKANSGQLSGEWPRIMKAKGRLDKAHLYIDDSSLNTPVEILSKCRRLKREKGLDMIMIDYLQLMSSGKRVESRQQEVADITRSLKIAAKELNVPILLLSQMSREIEKRKKEDKRPQMSDLRESGAIEQDADIIIFIHRKYNENDVGIDEETRNRVELIVAKHRNGERGSVEVRWCGENVTFKDIDAKSYLNRNIPPEQTGGTFIVSADEPDGNVFAQRSAEEIMRVPFKVEGDNNDDPF